MDRGNKVQVESNDLAKQAQIRDLGKRRPLLFPTAMASRVTLTNSLATYLSPLRTRPGDLYIKDLRNRRVTLH